MALRLWSGRLADRTHRYWTITIVGYAVNLLAVPLLALAGHWSAAAALMVLERVGKAIRTPARDVMLSYATTHTGRGWGFGLHEALDPDRPAMIGSDGIVKVAPGVDLPSQDLSRPARRARRWPSRHRSSSGSFA